MCLKRLQYLTKVFRSANFETTFLNVVWMFSKLFVPTMMYRKLFILNIVHNLYFPVCIGICGLFLIIVLPPITFLYNFKAADYYILSIIDLFPYIPTSSSLYVFYYFLMSSHNVTNRFINLLSHLSHHQEMSLNCVSLKEENENM